MTYYSGKNNWSREVLDLNRGTWVQLEDQTSKGRGYIYAKVR